MGDRHILGRDHEGRVIDIIVEGASGSVPSVAPQDSGGEHPDLAAHGTLGLATQAELATHAATPHGGEAGPHDHDADYEALGEVTTHAQAANPHPSYATDTDLTTHAATAHGTQPHAISGVSHTGTLDHGSLSLVTANQHHSESHKSRHATGGADELTVSDIGAAASGHNHDAVYSANGHTHTLGDGDIPAAIARDAEVTSAIATHAATPHGGEGGEAFPVGSVFLSVVSTDPATLLGYGTWAAFGAGRMLVGFDSGDAAFDTDEETGGAATHTHAGHSDHGALTHSGAAVAAHNVTQPSAHTDIINHTHATDSQGAHVHDEFRNSATTGGLDGWAVGDTSTNTPTLTGYDTGSAGAHTHTAQNPASGVASISHTGTAVDAHIVTQPSQHAAQSHSAHDSPTALPPYIVVHMWKRTA